MNTEKWLNPSDEQIDKAVDKWLKDGGFDSGKSVFQYVIDQVIIDQLLALAGKNDGS